MTPLAAAGPTPRDMVRDLRRIRRDPLTYLEGVTERFGDLVAFPLPKPVLLVNDPDGVRRVLVQNARNYTKATVQYGALSAVTGAGLLTADGEQWRRRRRIAQPAFHHGTLDGVATQAVRAARRIADSWRQLPNGTTVDVDAATMQATLEVVGRTLFDADLAVEGEQIVAAVQDALQVVVQRAQLPLPGWLLLLLPSTRRLRRAVVTLDATCAQVVRVRRERGLTDRDGDLLALLLRSIDGAGGLTDREVRDELVTLVIAGHETVASSLTWTLQLLAEHPSVQDALATELDDVLGGRDPVWGDLSKLTFTRQVVDEALRLYPPAWVMTRRAVEPDTIAGVDVPAGAVLIVSPWLLHRRAEQWPDSQRFDPQRFDVAISGSAGSGQNRSSAPRGDYLPFGWGPRLCIGRDFALVESVLMLATLLQQVRVQAPRRGGLVVRPAVDALVTLRPRGGLPLLVHQR